MADLLDRIQRALGASYRIERDLGGGMSRVFVAEDLRLGRKVVLKVLPPELAGGVNVERFEREVRLAARLQHPHIVPLLDAGSAGDLPYYLMPLVEGESLRSRLVREGELPLGEAVRLLREILDALAYAHAHGVVHRDIKPDNILLTAHHAVVTDFGVAKAVFDATSDARLTSTGISLGTPAYMAPEQIAGEPGVDHRADIYAVGSLAFEMVTGLPPFRGATTQQILAAHMSTPAPSLTTLRQAIPPVLDAIVLRCLEKRPADRWQSASEIIPQLDAVGSSGAISSPRATVPAAAAGRAVAPDRHPLRVAGLFGLVSLVMLAIVWSLQQLLGLPDWVFRSSIALLVAGLPIMLMTSLRERQRERAMQTATPTGIGRLFTWRRSIQGGVFAFAALGVAALLFMTSRAFGIGPGATLLSAGVLAPRDRLVIAEFDNRTPDSTLGLTITQLLRIDLAHSPSVSVMEPGQVALVLERMQRDPSTEVTAEIAREVTAREGIKAYLTGEILPAGTGFVIAARLMSPTTGDALVTLRQNVTSPEALLESVDRLSAELREEVGESLRSVRADPPLEQVTTRSLDALRLYARGTRAADHEGYDRAIELLQQAVAEDSGFAMAWRRLGLYIGNSSFLLRARADSAILRAWALRDRLPERERLLVEATVASTIEMDSERAVTAYLAVLEKHPNDVTALNNLGVAYEALGRTAESLEMFRRTIATGGAPALTYSNAVLGASGNLGLISQADTILAQFQRDFPDAAEIPEATIVLGTHKQDFQTVDSVARLLVRGPMEQRVVGHLSLSMLAELGGRMADASREYRNALRVQQTRGQLRAPEAAMLADFVDIRRSADYTTDPRVSADRLAALWEQNREFTAGRLPIQRRHRDFASLFARLGDTSRARQLIEEHLSIMTGQRYPAVGARVGGYLALATVYTATGRPEEAVTMIREGCGTMPGAYLACDRLAFLEVAEAFDRAGQADSAIAAYRRFAELRALRWFAPPRTLDLVTPRIAPAWRRLGELLEAKGEKQPAIDAYQRFLDFWREADPELQPIVRSVRERVDRLRRATG